MKNIVVDFSHIDGMYGFGDICRNYAPKLASQDVPELHFIYLLPEKFVGSFGNHIDYITREHPQRDIRRLGLHIDLWHATDQLFKYRYRSEGTLQLLTVHDLNFLYEKKNFHRWKHQFKLKHRVRHSDYITFISLYAERELLNQMQLEKGKYEVIYNGISPIDKTIARQPEFVKDAGQKFFFTVGQIRKKKNFHVLIPMMRRFPDYHLYISGDDHFKYARLIDEAIAEFGEDRIHLTGKISEENKIWMYGHCQAFLFPSLLEGFGIPVLEAMQMGCKVVSSRCSSLPEICGEHALYWENFEPEAMADVVSQALADDDAVHRDSRIEYAKGFNYDKYTGQYIALYKKLLNIG